MSQAPLADRRPPAGPAPPPSPLPAALLPLLGRERELADVQRLLSTARLVTLTGPGGVGKTRLALQVAHELHAAFAGGAHFISLAAINDPTLIIPTIVQALGLAESPGQLLFDSLKEFLRDRQILLVLDNFEQVISGAPLLTELLAACAGLRMLVTSRETLRVHGEQEFPLAPLELSNRALIPDQAPVESLLHYPGIALFVQRAQASQPEFKLTADNATAVAEICARLDGLPLALELAAARIKLLPPQAMLARLQESSLNLLSGGARDAPARQQTLRGTVQWSYDLLTGDEQCAFRWLAVFVNSCSLEAAIKVISQHAQRSVISNIEQDTAHGSLLTLDRVTSLVNKSLLRQHETEGEPRLDMLETIREFGLELLSRAQELEVVQRAHAEYYLSLAEEAEPHLTGREQRVWLNRLAHEQDNLRAALRWGFEHQEAAFILRLVAALWQFWFLRGQYSEGRRWFEEALSLASYAEVNMALRAKTLHAAATLILTQHDVARARALCERSVALYRELGDKKGLLAALLQLCRILDYQEDYEPMQALSQEGLALAEALPDVTIKAQAYAELAFLVYEGASSGMAARYLAESERIYRALDNPAGLASSLFASGMLAAAQGDAARADILHEEAARLATEVEDQRLKVAVFSHRMISDWQRGDYVSARRQFERLITILANVAQSQMYLEILAAILHGQGLSVWAARAYGLADKLARTSQSQDPRKRVTKDLRKPLAAARAEVRARLGDEAFAQALAEGQSMTADDLLAIPQPPPPDTTSHAQAVSASVPYEPLTARELEVLRLLGQDLSNPQIAERLVVSRRTVDAHLQSVYAKLGVKSRDAAVRVAMEHGLLEKRNQ